MDVKIDPSKIVAALQEAEADKNHNTETAALIMTEPGKQLSSTKQSFSNWNNGRTPAIIVRLHKMAKRCGVKIDDFLTES